MVAATLNTVLPFRSFELPWTLSEEQERRFRKISLRVLLATLLLALLFALLPAPKRDRTRVAEPPPPLAELILEKAPPPPEVEPTPPPVERRPVPRPTPPVVRPKKPTANERAAASIANLADDLAALREVDVVDQVVEASADLTAAPGAGPDNERSLITSRAAQSSGGINTAELSRGTGGGGLAGRKTTVVQSPVGKGAAGPGGSKKSAAGGPSSRSREEIERVFDRNKGAIYILYNRALRENPALRGKVVLRLTIQPNGAVTACEIVSSELNDPELERRLVQRVLLFRFDSKDVAPITTTKPVEFFPA